MDKLEKLTEQAIKDGEFIAEQVKIAMIEDRIGVMMLSGYQIRVWLERSEKDAKIRFNVELPEGDKGGISLQQLLNK